MYTCKMADFFEGATTLRCWEGDISSLDCSNAPWSVPYNTALSKEDSSNHFFSLWYDWIEPQSRIHWPTLYYVNQKKIQLQIHI